MQEVSTIAEPAYTTPVFDTNEEAIMKAFREGDKDAFREIYDRTVRPLTFFVENIVYSSIEAEDIVASAFHKLYNARTGMRSFEHVKRWLYVTVRNQSIDYLRVRARKRESHGELAYLDVASEEQMETERVKAELLRNILAEIDKLPRQRKAILRAYFFEQKTTAEIAGQLGLNPQTVLNHKAKALDALRKKGMKFRNLLEGIPAFVLSIIVLLAK